MITAVWLLNYRRSLAYGLGDDFPAGKEYNEGEYIVFSNKSGIVSVLHQSGAAIDVHADFYGLSAENLGDNVEIGMPEQSELQATVAVS
ncbi:MAG: hypothetical protein IPP17_31225 [Bacteroidetes bacterium]|nr:hypothetical protein [Bacteroidota bacterium]